MNTFKRALALVLVLVMALSVMAMPAAAAEVDFADVNDSDWFEGSVYRWADAGIINGRNASTFDPHAPISRSEFAKILDYMLGLNSELPENPFTDVDESAWYYESVVRCYTAGIVKGISDDEFAPEAYITREQAFVMMDRAFALKDAADPAKTLSAFVDGAEVSDWALAASASIVDYKAVQGGKDAEGNTVLLPKANITRAEVAAILDRVVGVYVDASGNISVTSEDGRTEGTVVGNLVIINAKQTDIIVVVTETDNGDVIVTVTNETTGESKSQIIENGETPAVVFVPQGATKPDINEVTEDEPVHIEGTEVVDHQWKYTPDAEKPGYHDGVCSCGDTVEDVACTLVEQANGDKVCSVCGYTVKAPAETEPTEPQPTECDHDYVESDCENCAVSYVPTLTCSICGDTAEGVAVDAHAHTFVEGVCSCCGMTEEEAMKFELKVSSKEEYVDLYVTNDYVAKITATPGKVDASEVTLYAAMQNVDSLGVASLREHEQTFNTSLTGDPELKVWLSNVYDFTTGTIVATIDGNETTYNLAGSTDEDGVATITGTPASVEATRTAWQALTSHVSTETQEASDSYITIANGSYLIIGDEILCFEKNVDGDLVLNDFSNLSGLSETIRNTVQAYAYESNDSVVAYLAAGTELAVSNSIATLEDNALITITSNNLGDADVAGILTKIKTAEGGYAMASELVSLLNTLIGKVEASVVYVDMTFSEPVEKATKFYLGVTADNADGNGTTTVDMEVYDDYSLEINVPMNEISAANVGLKVEMNNVGSLGVEGTKSHEINVSTGMTATGDLNFWLSNAKTFESATINATVDGKSVVYELTSDMDADWVTITGTADTEAARAAFHALTDHVTTSSQETDNSYFAIQPGSELWVANEALVFEEGADAMVLDNFGDLSALKQEIKDSVKVVEGDGTLKLVVAEGTVLAVGQSIATLDDTCTITISCANLDMAALEGTLSTLRDGSDSNETLVKTLFSLLDEVIGAANGAIVKVDVAFN